MAIAEIAVYQMTMVSPEKPAILFVCLGNICRSPLAEAAFRMVASKTGLAVEVDSAGTGDWHVGKSPDSRAMATAIRYGTDIAAYRARQLADEDFHRFTHIFALDHANLGDIRARAPHDSNAHISLLLDMVPGREGQAVADPYFGDEAGFDTTWQDVMEAAEALTLRFLR